MHQDLLSRRELFSYSIGSYLALEVIAQAQASKEDAAWEKAAKEDKYKQQALDEMLNASPDSKKFVSRFFAVYVGKAGTTRDKLSLIYGDKQLKCYDTRVESVLKEELSKQAEARAKARNVNPSKLNDEIKADYSAMVAELIARAEKKADTLIDLGESRGADVYLDFHNWGKSFLPIGIATKSFFESDAYKTAEDRKSFLIDYLSFGKAADMFRNPGIGEIWAGNKLDASIGSRWTDGQPGPKDYWISILKNRWFSLQGRKILDGKRPVSAEGIAALSETWKTSPELKYLAKQHCDNAAIAEKLSDEDTKRRLGDSMGVLWGVTCLPSNGKIVKYDPELVKSLQK